MCLFLYERQKKYRIFLNKKSDFAKKIRDPNVKEITCWKVYKVLDNEFASLIRNCPVEKAGVIKSDRKGPGLTKKEREEGRIDFGIHVHTTKKGAQRDAVSICSATFNLIVVPVICRTSDFVAEGYNNEAVFTKVRIRSRTWNKIFGNKEQN